MPAKRKGKTCAPRMKCYLVDLSAALESDLTELAHTREVSVTQYIAQIIESEIASHRLGINSIGQKQNFEPVGP